MTPETALRRARRYVWKSRLAPLGWVVIAQDWETGHRVESSTVGFRAACQMCSDATKVRAGRLLGLDGGEAASLAYSTRTQASWLVAATARTQPAG